MCCLFKLFTHGRHYVSCMPVDTSVTGTLQEGPANRAMALALSAFKGKRCLPYARGQSMQHEGAINQSLFSVFRVFDEECQVCNV